MPSRKHALSLLASFLTAALALAQQPNPAAWDAYRDNDLLGARDAFLAVARDPSAAEAARADALQGLFYLADDVGGVPSVTDIAIELFGLEHPPLPFLMAFHNRLTPAVVAPEQRPRVDSFYAGALARTDLTPALRSSLAFSRQIFDYVSGDADDALAELTQLRTIDAWSLAGDFRSPLGSGFDQEHGPLAHPETGAVFRNENNAAVTWYPLRHRRPGHVTHLSFFTDVDNTVNYAQTFVDVPAAGDYLLTFGGGGQLKVYVDDALVYREEEERHLDLDHLRLRLPLAAGPHRILLQLGAHERSNQSFFVRLLDADGVPVDVPASATPTAYTPNTALTAEVSFDPAFARGEACAKTGHCGDGPPRPASFAERLAYGQLLRSNSRYDELRDWVDALPEEDALAPFVVQLTSSVLQHEGDETGLAELEGRLKQAHPDHLKTLLQRYQEAMGDHEFAKAQTLLDRVTAIAGRESENMRLLQIGLDFQRQDMNAGVQGILAAREAFPASAQLLNMDILVAERVNNDPARALQLRRDYLADYNLDEQLNQLASQRANLGEQDEALGLYRELVRRKGFHNGYRLSVIGVLEQQERWADALAHVDTLLLQNPYQDDFHERRGTLLRQLDREPEAIAAFERSLALVPNDFDLRARIRDLRGDPSLYTLLDSSDERAVIAELGSRYDDTDHPIAQISDETQFVVYPDGVSEYRVELVYKVLNDRGIELLKEYGLSGVDIREARVIKPDGSTVDGEQGYGQVVFAKLAVGDYVHLDYRGSNAATGKFIGHFADGHAFTSWYPQGRTRFQLLVPEGKKFTYETTGGLRLSPKRETLPSGHERYTWLADDLPVVPSEAFAPAGSDAEAYLYFTSLPDWQFVSDWYTELSAARTKPDAAVRRQVATLFPDGAAGLTQEERVRRIYDFIARTIEYSSLSFRQSSHVPQAPGKTLASQLGDCKDVSSLFVAMASEVDVAADLVLVNTRDNGTSTMALPDQGFNHCIVRLRDSGDFLELTDKHLPVGAISNDLYGSVALPITGPGSGTDVTRVARGPRVNAKLVEQTATLRGEEMVLERAVHFTGSMASRARHRYVNESRDLQEELVRDHIDPRIDKPYRLGDFGFRGLETLGDTVTVDYDMTVDKALLKVQSLRLVQLPWVTAFTHLDFLNEEERTLPLALWRYASAERQSETIELRLPAGYSVLELPEAVERSVDGLSYTMRYEQVGDALLAHREWRMDRDEFAPEEYAGLRALFFDVQEADQQFIALQTPKAK